MAIIISNFSAATLEVLADEISNNTSILEINDNKEVTKAVVSKFDLYNSDKLNDYNNVFKIDNSKIESITNNGGQYSNSSEIDEQVTMRSLKKLRDDLNFIMQEYKEKNMNISAMHTQNFIKKLDVIIKPENEDSQTGQVTR